MRRTGILLCCLVGAVLTAMAMPPRPGSGLVDPTKGRPGFECPNPDAFTVIEGPDGLRVAVATLAKGTKRYPVLLVDFTDRGFHIARSEFDTLLFVTNGVASGSLLDYYRQASYGRDTITGNCYGWHHSANTQVYYGAGANGLGSYPRNAPSLVHEAVQLANASVDFSQFTQSTSGKLDLLIVVHAGPGAEGGPADSTNWIWSHNAALSQLGSAGGGTITADGVIIDNYTMQPEISALDPTYITQQIEIGVYAHELGHALGLPDLYDTDGSSEGVGRYCLMGSGSWGVDYYNGTPSRPGHPSPWCKKFLNWATPQTIGSDTNNLKLPPVETNPTIFRINTTLPNEYFLIENRQKVGFDSLCDGEGVLIWHQDETVITNGMATNHVNTAESHKGVDVEQAKGSQSLDSPAQPSNWSTYNRGDYRDFYPYNINSNFTNATTPNSNCYTGAASGVGLTNIAAGTGDTMTVSIGVPGFTIGLLQNPAFPQYLVIAATAGNSLLRPSTLDTAQMRISGSPTEALGFARIATSRSYEVDYELHIAGTHTVHIAAKDSADTTKWRRADRQFEVISGKAAGGPVYAGNIRLDLALGALARDLFLAAAPAAMAVEPGMLAMSQALQIGPEGYPLARLSQLAMSYSPAELGGRAPDRLGIYRLEGGQWRYLGGVLDQQGRQVLVEVDRLGTYLLAWGLSNPILVSLKTGLASSVRPNPFVRTTEIRYQLAKPGPVRLAVYNAAGQLVRELASGSQAAGLHRAVWDGSDGQGRAAASGVYLFRLEAGTEALTGRMVKVK